MIPSFRTVIASACALLAPVLASGHICNDVFIQAKDNLAVKVDIRDGQLRIGQEASFNVYVLNTMDRYIVAINLEVISDHFRADVQPDPSWRDYPRLETSLRGGKKEAFSVRLRRNPGVPDGRYNISLRLVNGQNPRIAFKTVDLAEAESVHALAQSRGINLDGAVNREEWNEALLCTDFYEYVKRDRFFENVQAQSQSRFRVAADRENLYFLLHFMGHENAQSDKATVYLARNSEAQPVAIEFDKDTGEVSAPGNIARSVTVSVVPDKFALECRIPRSALGLAGTTLFYLNFTRTAGDGGRETKTYWRGNANSFANPIVYDKVSLGF